ncbi:hypothetical protein SANTM175S_03655 [Streptomyces antimycoticus]
MARAGHPGPAIVHPDGAVEFPDLPAGLPLGLGGLPFEAVELQLAEGSQVALFTDGLVEDRHRDIDAGLELLGSALAGHPDRSMDNTCQAVLDALVPDDPSDDIALLMARTRMLASTQVTTWDVPADPAAVASIRSRVARQLADWGLEETAFPTELILSELVTNAIRYGSEPDHRSPSVRPHRDLRGVRRLQHHRPTCAAPRPPTRAGAACSSSPSSRSVGEPATRRTAR